MAKESEVLWLNVSHSLKCFDRPLLNYLSEQIPVTRWEYQAPLDGAGSFENAVKLLHEYMQAQRRPLHLVGHGRSGLLGLLYAQRYPETVRSLTLLSVGADPALDWQTHYYSYRLNLTWSRQKILQQMVCELFGTAPTATAKTVADLLEQDLDQSLSPHNLFRQTSLPPMRVSVPLMVCGSVNDVVVPSTALRDWQQHFSDASSRLWVCPGGRYFFHYFYPEKTGDSLLHFWRSLPLYIRTPWVLEPLIPVFS
ncbi:alpha/beta hydrolase [Phormidium tenue FACHB-886]|nr:alpha/beta hydrolase [Phormidium tenue FACHB-886]